MARKSTLRVTSETREQVNDFKEATDGCSSADEAVTELLRIAADEGYWDGEGGTAAVSAERVAQLEADLDETREVLKTMRKEMHEYHQ